MDSPSFEELAFEVEDLGDHLQQARCMRLIALPRFVHFEDEDDPVFSVVAQHFKDIENGKINSVRGEWKYHAPRKAQRQSVAEISSSKNSKIPHCQESTPLIHQSEAHLVKPKSG